MFWDLLLYGAIIPGCATGCFALIFAQWSRAAGHETTSAAAAVGGGFAVAFAAYFGMDGLLAPQSWQWIFWASAAAIPIGFFRGRLSQFSVLVVYCAVAAMLLLLPMIAKLVPHELATQQVWLWSAWLAVSFAVLTLLFELSARSYSARVLAPVWVVYAAGLAGLFFELASARLGQMGGFVAAAFGALMVLSWLQPQRAWLKGGSVVFILVFGQLAANAYFFGYDVQGLPLILAALPAALLAAAAHWEWFPKSKPLAAIAGLILLVLLPLALAFWVAMANVEVDPYAVPY